MNKVIIKINKDIELIDITTTDDSINISICNVHKTHYLALVQVTNRIMEYLSDKVSTYLTQVIYKELQALSKYTITSITCEELDDKVTTVLEYTKDINS